MFVTNVSIMDTSTNHYETVMCDLLTYGRGLEEYCHDEAVNYRWIEKAKELYGVPTKRKSLILDMKSVTKTSDMIQLHFEAERGET